jgi:homoserine kinase
MSDRLHQPYRAAICPLLPRLLPLAGSHGILGAALSGAGPSVLVIVEEKDLGMATEAIRQALVDFPESEIRDCRFENAGASQMFGQSQK